MSLAKVLFVCDKNECTSFGRLTLNLVKAVSGKFDAHVLWLKTPKFFGEADKNAATSQDSNYVSHEVWAKSLYTGYLSFRAPLKKLVKKIQPEIRLSQVLFFLSENSKLSHGFFVSDDCIRTSLSVHIFNELGK